MRWKIIISFLAAATGCIAQSRRSSTHDSSTQYRQRDQRARPPVGVSHDHWTRDGPIEKKFASEGTARFAINGSALPDVDFDIGEAYAGQLSISDDADGQDKFYFWFQPSPNPQAKKEIVIWLNGGPGCSSLEGWLQENGPMMWQYGTFKPVPNPWGWHHLTNMLWVDQPLGTGFSTGEVTATNEEDIAKQFLGFFKNFIKTFSMQGYSVYITGESYAGMYCPYIASAMLDANDKTYYDMRGVMLYDPSIAERRLQSDITAVPFIEHHRSLFPFNESYWEELYDMDEKCGFAAYRKKYLTYPPAGHLPSELPGTDVGCDGLMFEIADAISLLNPCWDIYQIATTCPLLWDNLGFPGSFGYLPKGASIYFDRQDVKQAIHAPENVEWAECSSGVFIGQDSSGPSANTVLGGVIDRTQNVIIGHGQLDMVLIANGTLLAIQNMTFGGKIGFQRRPTMPFYVPYHQSQDDSALAGAGVFGTTHSERGLTYVGINLAGHMIPQYAPSAAFRHLEVLLGRVESLSSTAPFTTDSNVPQSSQ